MKKLSEIVVFSFLIAGLLTSGISENKPGEFLPGNFLLQTITDTTGYLNLIKADSFNLTIFPPASGVQFYRNGIVFLYPSKYEQKMLSGHISFGNIEAYYAVPEDSILGKHTIFSQSSYFTYPCDAVTFSSDFNTMYFTKLSENDHKEKIYMAKFTSESKKRSGWLSEKYPLNFCSENFTYTHPTLSADGEIMIFASEKESSLGTMDLFITRKEGDKWVTPINLGNLINTTGNEFYPFLDSGNNLFFSSDGLPGFGGSDVFACKFNGEGWDKPMNLSGRINSENDDIAFTLSKSDGKTAFFTKRRIHSKNEMQLFKVTLAEAAADSNQITISYIFNGKPRLKTSLTTLKIFNTFIPVKTELAKAEFKSPPILPQIKKEVKVPDTTVNITSIPEKKAVIVPQSIIKPREAKVVSIQPTVATPDDQKDVVIYRIQFLSGLRPIKDNQIIVNRKSYKIYEYYYLGEYRYTIGDFRTLAPAKELQNTCRRSGYPQAFVAAFKNNTRSLDLELFK